MKLSSLFGMVALGLSFAPLSAVANDLEEIRIDWATYNPVSLVMKEKGLLEAAFAQDGVEIVWVQSAGSNKALEFLNASSIDFGSTAGSAALTAKINGNPIRSIYVYSKPEWTALVTRPDAGIDDVGDLAGKSVAVTRGTDPHAFLIRALAAAGLSEDDVRVVLLQHADGRTALVRGDVDAWAGLDPMMAAAELQDGAVLFHRDSEANTYGVLNVRSDFLEQHPEAVARVLEVYEEARVHALENPDELKRILTETTGLPPEVIDRQIDERTDLTSSRIGPDQREALLEAGVALQSAGVLEHSVDVEAAVDALVLDALPEATN
jgi:sulfonate transport system substrate-binding protein